MPISSFRDPSGFLLTRGEQIFRIVHTEDAEDLFRFLESRPGRGLLRQGHFIASRYAAHEDRDLVLDDVADRICDWESAAVLEHERVWFPSYPFEWPSLMLAEAARVTLDIAAKLQAENLGLKDATPYNVLFRGPDAVFVDATSIEKRDPTDPLWRPLGQFLQTFLYPLILERTTGARSCETLFGRREGVTSDEVYQRLTYWQRLRYLRWVSIPHWLSGRKLTPASYRPQSSADAEAAGNIFGSTLRALHTAIAAAEATSERSVWNTYAVNCHYDDASRAAKHGFVTQALSRFENGRVLDLGANDGEYSLVAARAGHQTVACDLDAACMNALWRQVRVENLAVLPLVLNLANPSPAMGWNNQETKPFLERAREARFDCVLLLALLHHLTITERVPLAFVVDLAADLTTEYVVIEWVGPEDLYYQALLRGRQSLHANDTREAFESACSRRFEIVSTVSLSGGRRWLYLLAKHGS